MGWSKNISINNEHTLSNDNHGGNSNNTISNDSHDSYHHAPGYPTQQNNPPAIVNVGLARN